MVFGLYRGASLKDWGNRFNRETLGTDRRFPGGRWRLVCGEGIKILSAASDTRAMASVLIVDDDEVTRLILGRMLEDSGHEVVYANDGVAALRAFRLGRFDAVFTDLAMPEKNGFLLMREIKERDHRLPVIAMSGVNAENLIMAQG